MSVIQEIVDAIKTAIETAIEDAINDARDIVSAIEQAIERAIKDIEDFDSEIETLLKSTFPLPLTEAGLKNLPAYPFNLVQTIKTLFLLKIRQDELTKVVQGYSQEYTIAGQTAPGYSFLYGDTTVNTMNSAIDRLLLQFVQAVFDRKQTSVAHAIYRMADGSGSEQAAAGTASSLTTLPLDSPDQFTIGLTSYQSIFDQAKPQSAEFAKALQDADEASRQFWPMIAKHGQAYNLIILQKLTDGKNEIKKIFKDVWSDDLQKSAAGGELFFIDLRIFEYLDAASNAQGLFTPATVTLLRREAATKQLLPVAVMVGGETGTKVHVYTRHATADAAPSTTTDQAWIYALEAARTSVAIYGIAIGHVYHWHLSTAALVMTFQQQNMPTEHGLQYLVTPQSDYLIGFDDVLLLTWGFIVPPMSISSGLQFLSLADRFAAGRTFYDDDPLATLAALGLRQEDFTDVSPWDLYPVVADLLHVWAATEDYIGAFIEQYYPTDAAVAGDSYLQNWIADSADASKGNIRGLQAIETTDDLRKFLQSLLFRINMHGVSRINQTAYPTLAFVANYPTCLTSTSIPSPTDPLTTADLLKLLPNTGQIGRIMSFYNIFVFTRPYASFIPEDGVAARPQFPDGNPCNAALMAYRKSVSDFIKRYQQLDIEVPEQSQQWPLCIET